MQTSSIVHFSVFKSFDALFQGYAVGYGNIAMRYDTDNTAALHREQILNDLGGSWKNFVALSPCLQGPLQQVNQHTKIVIQDEAVMTMDNQTLLVLPLADCRGSVVFFSNKKGENGVALLHSSWRSLSKQYALQAVQKLIKMGCASTDMFVGITPGLCAKHLVLEYLDEKALQQENWEKADAITHEPDGWHLDTKKYLLWQYQQAGIPAKNIEVDEACTYEVMEKAQEENVLAGIYSHKYAMTHALGQERFWLVAGLQ